MIFGDRIRELLDEESASPERWFYCSFADDEAGGFRGGLIIKARGAMSCRVLARAMSINPGGQMAAFEIPDEMLTAVPVGMRNKLLAEIDVKSIWPDAATIKEHRAAGLVP